MYQPKNVICILKTEMLAMPTLQKAALIILKRLSTSIHLVTVRRKCSITEAPLLSPRVDWSAKNGRLSSHMNIHAHQPDSQEPDLETTTTAEIQMDILVERGAIPTMRTRGGRSVISLAIQHVLSHTLQTSGAEVATIAVSLQFAFILKSKEQA